MRPRILLSLLPVLVFLALSRVAPPWFAILGGFGTSAAVFAVNRQSRLIGWLTIFGFAVVSVSAVVGIVGNSEKAYLASGPLSDFLFVPLYIGSVIVRRPLVGGIARELVPAIAGRVPLEASVYSSLSLAWAAFDLVHGIGASYLLARLSVAEYVIWSRVAFWPFSGALLLITAGAIWFEARRLAVHSAQAFEAT